MLLAAGPPFHDRAGSTPAYGVRTQRYSLKVLPVSIGAAAGDLQRHGDPARLSRPRPSPASGLNRPRSAVYPLRDAQGGACVAGGAAVPGDRPDPGLVAGMSHPAVALRQRPRLATSDRLSRGAQPRASPKGPPARDHGGRCFPPRRESALVAGHALLKTPAVKRSVGGTGSSLPGYSWRSKIAGRPAVEPGRITRPDYPGKNTWVKKYSGLNDGENTIQITGENPRFT